jgi:hypothetical protein
VFYCFFAQKVEDFLFYEQMLLGGVATGIEVGVGSEGRWMREWDLESL